MHALQIGNERNESFDKLPKGQTIYFKTFFKTKMILKISDWVQVKKIFLVLRNEFRKK